MCNHNRKAKAQSLRLNQTGKPVHLIHERGSGMRKKEHIYEEYLVASAKLGDHRAMTRLVELRGPKLLAHATRLLGNPEQAKDATQDAWAEILKGLSRLLQTQRNIADEMRQETPRTEPDRGPEATDARNVRQALKSLPPNQQATIALFYLEDMSVAEVAKALNIPAGTVKTRLMHARTKLKTTLKGDDDA